MTRRYTGGFLSAKEQATDANTANGIFTLQEAAAATATGNFPTGRWTPQRSLRFRSAASSYLSRTPSVSGNRKTWTFSVWVKLGTIPGSDMDIFGCSNPSDVTTRGYIRYDVSTSAIQFFQNIAGTNVLTLIPNEKHRDFSSWYHVVVSIDTTQAVASDRAKMYINGRKVTSFSTATYPSQNTDLNINTSGYSHVIGVRNDSSSSTPTSTTYWDGYMSEAILVDGQSLDSSYFGFTDPETGTWVPKRYTGTYGTNGFYLPFKDNQTTVTLGKNYGNGGNLFTYSNTFSNAAWVNSGNTIVSTNNSDPLGGSAASLITLGSGYVPYYRNSSLTAGAVYTASAYFKAGTQVYASISVGDGSLTSAFGATFKLDTGTIQPSIWIGGGNQYSSGNATIINKYITPLSNGWYRCVVTGIVDSSTSTIRTDFPIGAGTGGTNIYQYGFQLEYGSEVGAYQNTTSSTISNDFAVSNISLTAGATYDSMVDVPGIAAVSSQQDIGGVVRGNYCTLNPLQLTNVSLTNGNLTVSSNGSNATLQATMSFPESGKYYFEFVPADMPLGTSHHVGIQDTNSTSYTSEARMLLRADGNVYDSVGLVRTISSFTTNDVVGIAVDIDAGTCQFYKNGALNGAPFSGKFYGYKPYWLGNNPANGTFNFGQRPFAHTPPSGFKSLCVTNFPNPVIKRPSDHFDIKLYTGTGTTAQTIAGSNQKQTSAYQIQNSVRVNSTGPGYIYRSPGSTGSRTKMTFAGWFKLADAGAAGGTGTTYIFNAKNAGNTTSEELQFGIRADVIRFVTTDASNNSQFVWDSAQKLKDLTSWNHIMFAVDTTHASSNERVKVYLNGKLLGAASGSSYPAQNTSLGAINVANNIHNIGRDFYQTGTGYHDFYATELYFIDAQTLTPASFGQFDANNMWVPKQYTGTYGTTGWYLPTNRTPSIGNSSYAASFTSSRTQSVTYASNAAFAIGTGNFTVETYINFASWSGAENRIFMQDVSGASNFQIGKSASNNNLFLTIAGTGIGYEWYPRLNTWYHLAVVRNSGTVTIYIDGKAVKSQSAAGSIIARDIILGGLTWASNYHLNGKLSNFRYSNTARYTTNFTPATSTLTSDANTLLLAFTGTTLADSGPLGVSVTNNNSTPLPYIAYPFAVNEPAWIGKTTSTTTTGTFATAAGSPTLSATQSKFGGYSAYFNGSSASRVYLSSSAADWSANDQCTIEYWIYPTAFGSTANGGSTVLGHGDIGSTAEYWSFGPVSGGTVKFYYFNGGVVNVNTGNTISTNQWSHLAMVKDGSVMRFYINGNLVYTHVMEGTPLFATSYPILIGAVTNSGSTTGYIEDLRITNGIARYSGSSFTLPTTANPMDSTDPYFGFVSLGASFDNTWTVYTNNNFNVKNLNATYDSSANDNLTDTPTDHDPGTGQVRGNYAILDRNSADGGTYTYGGLQYQSPAVDQKLGLATHNMWGTNGKWYCEVTIGTKTATYWQLGVFGSSTQWNPRLQYRSDGYAWIDDNNAVTNWASYTTGDVIGMAFDVTTETLSFYKNGVLQGSLPYSGTAKRRVWKFGVGSDGSGGVNNYTVNFGQRPFAYTPPSGYLSLNTKNMYAFGGYNLPDSYGNYLTTPDLVMLKRRSASGATMVYDTTRGATKALETSNSNAENTEASGLIEFVPTGFRVGSDSNANAANTTFVAWCWNKDKVAGFNVVPYTGTGVANQRVEHGLGATPAFIIEKNTQDATRNWPVWHKSFTATDDFMYLSNTNAKANDASTWAAIDSTAFGLGKGTTPNTSWSAANQKHVAYVWAEVPGYSKFGSYTGNGSADGPFLHCGFRPKFILIRKTSDTDYWKIYDTARDPVNPALNQLYPNASDAEDASGSTAYSLDFVSNGVKIRGSGSGNNASGATFLFAAFAEAPFKYANAR